MKIDASVTRDVGHIVKDLHSFYTRNPSESDTEKLVLNVHELLVGGHFDD